MSIAIDALQIHVFILILLPPTFVGSSSRTSAVLISDDAPGYTFPQNNNKKTALRFRKAVCGALCSGLSRALKTPHWGVFAPRYAERGARAVLVPDGAPIRSIPGNRNKKTALRFP